VAPSIELRKWYGHDVNKWQKVQGKIRMELEFKKGLLSKLATDSRQDIITFVLGSKEEKLNNAAALKECIEKFFHPEK